MKVSWPYTKGNTLYILDKEEKTSRIEAGTLKSYQNENLDLEYYSSIATCRSFCEQCRNLWKPAIRDGCPPRLQYPRLWDHNDVPGVTDGDLFRQVSEGPLVSGRGDLWVRRYQVLSTCAGLEPRVHRSDRYRDMSAVHSRKLIVIEFLMDWGFFQHGRIENYRVGLFGVHFNTIHQHLQ